MPGSIWMQRNADVATIDSRDVLDDDGELTPDRAQITVPPRSSVSRVLFATGNDFSATGESSTHGRLVGTGIDGAPVKFGGNAYGVNTATGNYRDDPAVETPLGRATKSNGTITVEAEFSGAGDVDYEMGVGLEFRNEPVRGYYPEKADYPLWPLVLEGDMTTVDSSAALATEGSVTAPDRNIPDGYKSIWGIQFSVGADHAAAGSTVWILHLSGASGSWLQDGDQRIPVAGGGGQAVQTGADPTATACTGSITDANVGIMPTAVATVNGVMAGDDAGTSNMNVTLLLSPRAV